MLRLTCCLLAALALCTDSYAYNFSHDWYVTGTVGDGFADEATTVGDVNGDGYSDIVISSPQFGSSPFWSKGKVSLYYGSPTVPSSTPDWEYSVNIAFQQLGHAVAPAGDMNADGFADFVVSAPYYSGGHSEEGRLYFFQGGPTGPSMVATAEINDDDAWLGYDVGYAGDVNGDGYDDVIAGAPGWGGFGSPFFVFVQGAAYVYYGGSTIDGNHDWSKSGADEFGEFGWSVDGLGDVNNDGYSDVVVGQPGYDTGIFNNNYGRVNVFHGSASGPSSSADWTTTGPNIGDEFGREVSYVGDTSGASHNDLLIGVPDYNGGAGAVFMAHGSDTGLGARSELDSGVSSNWGGTVSPIGDFNGDGRADFIVGGGVNDDAYVYFGPTSPTPESIINGSGQFATTVASAGDVNGDGHGDFLVTDPLDQSGAGSVRLYLGGRKIVTPLRALAFGDPAEGPTSTMMGAGDVNGDGVGDFMVANIDPAGAGVVNLYFGEAGGWDGTADWTTTGDGPVGSYGRVMSPAGDINGDGYGDIVIADPDLQQLRVFHGSPTGPSTTPDWVYDHHTPGVQFGVTLSGDGDLNGDGYADIAVGSPGFNGGWGRVHVFYGGPSGMHAFSSGQLSSPSPFRDFGTSVAIVGDTNGDGFDDLAVGGPGSGGGVYIYLGTSTGFQTNVPHFPGSYADGQMGLSVAAAGDVNGDGLADIVAGEPYADLFATDDGLGHVIFGGIPFPDPGLGSSRTTFSDVTLQNDAHFGLHVAGLGSFDGSDRSVVAASYWDPSQNETIVGLYTYGTSMTQEEDTIVFGAHADIHLSSLGDIEGDGIGDMGIADPGFGGSGAFMVFGPIAEHRTLAPPNLPRVMTTLNDPIAVRGLCPISEGLRFSMNAWQPIGRANYNMQWELGEAGQPYSWNGNANWTISAEGSEGVDFVIDPSAILQAGKRYRWRTRAVTTNPYYPFGRWTTPQSNTSTLYGFQVIDTVTSVDPTTPQLASGLESAYPNPFNPSTQLEFRLPQAQPVELSIYNVAGRLVKTLHRGPMESGTYRVEWTGQDDQGTGVASGVYVAVLRTGGESSSLKLTLVK